MKKTLFLFLTMCCFAFAANAQNKRDGTPDMRYRANKEAYGNSYSTPAPQRQYSQPVASPSPRPYYGGGQHTEDHGGTYEGGTGDGTRKGTRYNNPETGNRYGKHQPY